MTHLQARSEKEKNRRKKVIVAAAKKLFYDKGYSVSVDEIAAAAITDPRETVARDLEKIRTGSASHLGIGASGYVYDVGNGTLTEVP